MVESPEAEIAEVPPADVPVPPAKRRGRPPGSKTKRVELPPDSAAPVQDIEDMAEEPPRSARVPERTPEPVAHVTPVVMKRKPPQRAQQDSRAVARSASRANTPAPNAGEIADALLNAWEGRRGQQRPGRAALYSSWL